MNAPQTIRIPLPAPIHPTVSFIRTACGLYGVDEVFTAAAPFAQWCLGHTKLGAKIVARGPDESPVFPLPLDAMKGFLYQSLQTEDAQIVNLDLKLHEDYPALLSEMLKVFKVRQREHAALLIPLMFEWGLLVFNRNLATVADNKSGGTLKVANYEALQAMRFKPRLDFTGRELAPTYLLEIANI